MQICPKPCGLVAFAILVFQGYYPKLLGSAAIWILRDLLSLLAIEEEKRLLTRCTIVVYSAMDLFLLFKTFFRSFEHVCLRQIWSIIESERLYKGSGGSRKLPPNREREALEEGSMNLWSISETRCGAFAMLSGWVPMCHKRPAWLPSSHSSTLYCSDELGYLSPKVHYHLGEYWQRTIVITRHWDRLHPQQVLRKSLKWDLL